MAARTTHQDQQSPSPEYHIGPGGCCPNIHRALRGLTRNGQTHRRVAVPLDFSGHSSVCAAQHLRVAVLSRFDPHKYTLANVALHLSGVRQYGERTYTS